MRSIGRWYPLVSRMRSPGYICCVDGSCLQYGGVLGKIQIDGEDYSINEEFKEGTLQLADALSIDELEAAGMFMAAEEESVLLDRSRLETSIIRFHQRRQYILESLRLILKLSLDTDGEEAVYETFKNPADNILK